MRDPCSSGGLFKSAPQEHTNYVLASGRNYREGQAPVAVMVESKLETLLPPGGSETRAFESSSFTMPLISKVLQGQGPPKRTDGRV